MPPSVIPAKAGTQRTYTNLHAPDWVPAFAGMTEGAIAGRIDVSCVHGLPTFHSIPASVAGLAAALPRIYPRKTSGH
jgi:hypothetical protein